MASTRPSAHIALTRRGSRCQNSVEYGQLLGQCESQLGAAGYVTAYGSLGPYDAVDVDQWLAQPCTLHDSTDVIDHETPELRRFDMTRDAWLIKPYRMDAAYDGVPSLRYAGRRCPARSLPGAPGDRFLRPCPTW